MRRRSIAALALLAALAVVAPLRAAPLELRDDRGVLLRFERAPTRIVTLLPSLTETVCELGACERLVGTDRYSNWPASVQALPKLGGLEDPQVERLYALRPDLVLAAKSARVLERLEALGLKVMALESLSLADTRRSIGVVAQVLGRPDAGRALFERIEARVRGAARRVPPSWHGARAYVEVAGAPFAAGEVSFIGELLAALGVGNAVPAALGPFPKLNPEYVVRARPELVLASQRGLAGMPKRPGWDRLDALRRGHACGFDEARWELLIRPGPRLGEAAEIVADCLAALPPRAEAGR
ncbi:MAG TPA: helical backbone metal receptor [Methylibium sp.]|nr:helical backbone metal receptor [Methylibium sp.]